MQEIFKDIKGYKSLYQVSDKGRIKSLSKYKKSYIRNVEICLFKEKILKVYVMNIGYGCVKLCKDKKIKQYLIHRLVAQAFILNPENKPQVNHIDGDKLNNSVDNLEWCTAKENIKHAWKNGFCKKLYGKDSHLSKPVQQYDLEGNFIAEYVSQYDARNKTGISNSNISSVCRKKVKTAGGFIWKFI